MDLRCEFPSFVFERLRSCSNNPLTIDSEVLASNLTIEEMKLYVADDFVELPTAILFRKMVAKCVVNARRRLFALLQIRFLGGVGAKDDAFNVCVSFRICLLYTSRCV